MKIAFRTDASLQMGSGHVMRCLTLADALRARGAQCHFISRLHPGHLLELIRQRGYKSNSLLATVQQAQAAIKQLQSQGKMRNQTSALSSFMPPGWALPGKPMRSWCQPTAKCSPARNTPSYTPNLRPCAPTACSAVKH